MDLTHSHSGRGMPCPYCPGAERRRGMIGVWVSLQDISLTSEAYETR